MISSMESCIVVSVCLMISDDPVCPRAWERALLRIIIRVQGAWSTPPLAWKTSSHSNWGIRDLQEGIWLGWCGARIWGSHWSSMTGVEPICWGAAQTHSTANANIRYRPQNILTAPSADIWQSPYLGCIPTFKRRLSSSSPPIFSQRLWNLDGQF